MLEVLLDVLLVELSSNKSLGVEDSLQKETRKRQNRLSKTWKTEGMKLTFRGFWGAWFFAASPTRRSSSVKATHEGVIRFPKRQPKRASAETRQSKMFWKE